MSILNKFSRKLAEPTVKAKAKEASSNKLRVPDKKQRKQAYIDIIVAVDMDMARRRLRVN